MSQSSVSNNIIFKPLTPVSTDKTTNKQQQDVNKEKKNDTKVNIEGTTNRRIINSRVEQNMPITSSKETSQDEIREKISNIQIEIDEKYRLKCNIETKIGKKEKYINELTKVRDASEDSGSYLYWQEGIDKCDASLKALKNLLNQTKWQLINLKENKKDLQEKNVKAQARKIRLEGGYLIKEIRNNIEEAKKFKKEMKEYSKLMKNIPISAQNEESYIKIKKLHTSACETLIILDKKRNELQEALKLVINPSYNSNNINSVQNNANNMNSIHNNDSDPNSINNNDSQKNNEINKIE